MKGKLIKTDDGYILEGNNLPNPRRLSLKNCEAIANGYDLDEFVEEYTENILRLYTSDIESQKSRILFYGAGIESFKEGFKKALEILGDKKFSEEDLSKAILLSRSMEETFDTIVKSLQQNEWQVEVITDRIPADLAPGRWDVFPKLDTQGCLILKKM